jgi:K+-transporting ATPase A subunit
LRYGNHFPDSSDLTTSLYPFSLRLTATEGTLPTHGPLFVSLLIGTVLLVGLLNYVPALALGPMVEHLMLWPH